MLYNVYIMYISVSILIYLYIHVTVNYDDNYHMLKHIQFIM